MKLVEILAKELKEWPSNTDSIWQDHDSELRFYGNRDTSLTNIYVSALCDDCLRKEFDSTPENRVTEQMWEAEKVKLNAQNAPVFAPIYCRDRIKEIDTLVESLEEERVSLVQALEDEGFALVNAALISPKVASAAPVEDMSDWRNWKKGDLLECVSHKNVWSREQEIGSTYSIICEPDSSYSGDDDLHTLLETGYYVNPEDFKFHSRPQ